MKPAARGTETILVVEDEDGVRALTRHVLTKCGYTVLHAADGEEALRIAGGHSGSIHLLATDVVIPRLGSRQLAEQLLQLHPETKVLYLSGYTDDAVVRHGVHDEQVNFLQKPFAPHLLSRKVRDILDAAQATPLCLSQGEGQAGGHATGDLIRQSARFGDLDLRSESC